MRTRRHTRDAWLSRPRSWRAPALPCPERPLACQAPEPCCLSPSGTQGLLRLSGPLGLFSSTEPQEVQGLKVLASAHLLTSGSLTTLLGVP